MAYVKLTSLNISGGKPVVSNVTNGAGTLSPYAMQYEYGSYKYLIM